MSVLSAGRITTYPIIKKNPLQVIQKECAYTQDTKKEHLYRTVLCMKNRCHDYYTQLPCRLPSDHQRSGLHFIINSLNRLFNLFKLKWDTGWRMKHGFVQNIRPPLLLLPWGRTIVWPSFFLASLFVAVMDCVMWQRFLELVLKAYMYLVPTRNCPGAFKVIHIYCSCYFLCTVSSEQFFHTISYNFFSECSFRWHNLDNKTNYAANLNPS